MDLLILESIEMTEPTCDFYVSRWQALVGVSPVPFTTSASNVSPNCSIPNVYDGGLFYFLSI